MYIPFAQKVLLSRCPLCSKVKKTLFKTVLHSNAIILVYTLDLMSATTLFYYVVITMEKNKQHQEAMFLYKCC